MSGGQRVLQLRASDFAIKQAVEIALAQIGDHLDPVTASYFNLTGNKEEGLLQVEMFGIRAHVYCNGFDENTFFVDRVVFDVLSGKALDPPKEVKINKSWGNNDLSLDVAFSRHLIHRKAVLYHVSGVAVGWEGARRILGHLWEYPMVTVDGGAYRITYEFNYCHDAQKIELWFDPCYGWTKATFDERLFHWSFERHDWVECK